MPMIKQSRCGCRRAIGVRLTLKIVEETLIRTIKARPPVKKEQPLIYHQPSRETAFDRPRDFLGNRFVYAVISSAAGGTAQAAPRRVERRRRTDLCRQFY